MAVTRQQLRAARREIDDLRAEISERRVGDERRADAAAAAAAAAAARSPARSPAEARSSVDEEAVRQASALASRVQHLEAQVEHEVLRTHEAAQRQQACEAPTSPLHLPYISPTSPLHLAYISPTSRLHLAYISPTSPDQACEAQARHASQMLSAMQATLQRESIERSKLAASLSASHRQLETTQAALQSKELTIAKMRSRIGSSNTTGALAQDMARLGYTLGLKST